MAPKPWREPQDKGRSLKVRTEGLMRKCLELTNLGVRVALYIEKVDDGKAFCYKTHPDLKPSWKDPVPKPSISPQRPTTPLPANKQATQSAKIGSSPSIPDLDSLHLAWPSAVEASPPRLVPDWDDLEIVDIPRESVNPDPSPDVNPTPRAYQQSPGTSGVSRKRPHPALLDDFEEPPRKRERSTSAWFDD